MDVATIATITIIIMIAMIRLVRLLLKFMILSPTISIIIVILYLFYRLDYAILRYCGLDHPFCHLMVTKKFSPRSLSIIADQ